MQQIVKVRRISNPRRKKRNPVRVLTLGRKNPRSTMKRRTRRKAASTTTRRRRRTVSAAPRRRRRNPVARRATSRRRRNPTTTVIRRRRSVTVRRRRRNPNLFGRSVGTSQLGQAIIGGLIGVTAAKMIPAALPVNLTATPIMQIISTGASAWLAGMLAGRFSQPFGDAVFFGGMMQMGSIALNAFLPSVGGRIALNGMRGGLGELVSGAFAVPQNPLMPSQANYPAYGRPMIADASYGSGAPVTMNGVSRAFGRAF